ncbi:MAG: hypothetical protein WC306_00275 [Candidatus Paceibacterota bacterium]|jgi:hypothetical protein
MNDYKIKNWKLKAQSLLEALLSITLGVLLIGSSVGLIGLSLRSFNSVKQRLQVNSLMRQTAEVIQSLTNDNWHSIYDLTKESNYQIATSGNTWTISSGQEISTINNIPYKKYFQVSNVNRDLSGDIAVSGTDDPSTQKITIFLEYGNNYVSSSTLTTYLTRSYNNQVFQQTDWSEGSGQTGPISNSGNKFDTADSNINYASTTGSIYMTTATTTEATLVSSVLDTGVSGGTGFNSLLWQGSLGTGGTVKFQIAFSNSSTGPWTYYGPTSVSDYYSPNPNVSIAFPTASSASPQNKRYIRYKVFLFTSSTTPQINDIIINWAP